MRILLHLSFTFLHGVLWLFGILVMLSLIAMGVLAYGIPGRWVEARINRVLPESVGKVTVGHLAFRPHTGLVITDFHLRRSSDNKILVAFSHANLEIHLFARNLTAAERVRNLSISDLYVAQIEWPENAPIDQVDTPHAPFPDLSKIEIPLFNNVALRLDRPMVLDISVKQLTGVLQTSADGILHFEELHGILDNDKESVDATIAVDLHDAKLTARIFGNIYQTRVNGVYRALNFPIIEDYSNNFILNAPARGDCAFVVGFDKWRNLFDFRVDIIANGGGTYCGVPFDEAKGTILCKGIFDAVTTISPIVVRRNGHVAATGSLRFDCPADRFSFNAKGHGLSPEECLRLIDLPFTETIPAISSNLPPAVSIEGSIPLLTEQAPEHVILKGHVSIETCMFDKIPLAAAEVELAMTNSVFSLTSLRATLPTRGVISGSVDITVPHSAEYVDIHAINQFQDAALSNLLTPFNIDTLTNSTINGSLDFRCRTDDTFLSSINGDCDLKLAGGLIGRLPLFAGFTDIMAEHVPGISAITDSSTAHLQGTITNGVFNLPDFSLSGDLFSIEGPVTYNIPENNINAKVIAGIFKRNTLMGELTRWASVPFSTLMMQIHVTGPFSNPQWHVLTLPEKILDKSFGFKKDEDL